MVKISPSLAAAPTDRLGQVVSELEQAGADYVHIDIEDGSFVPVMTLGTKLIPDLRPQTDLPFDVHLMMVNPEWILPQLANDGADRVAVHLEACPYPRRTLKQIHRLGMVPGLALNPVTPLPDLTYLFPYLQFVILLSTEPEDEGCPFLPEVLKKLHQAKMVPKYQEIEWVVDGGIGMDNLAEVVKAGADTVVIGRAAFAGGTVLENMERFHQLLNKSE
jgi:ribulose-phosphate 3-epimerase